MSAGTSPHNCPGGCGRKVAHHRLSCPRCWYQLPADLRRMINATYAVRSDPEARRAHAQALLDARRWYDNHTATPLDDPEGV